ncbi:MAG: hypothetical protein ACMUHB_00435 [Thermoplasmatota archaeon]
MYMDTAISFLGKWVEEIGDTVTIKRYEGKFQEWKIKIIWEKWGRTFYPLTGKIMKRYGIGADGKNI